MSQDLMIELTLAILVGAVLGLFYFAGLWLTVRGLGPQINLFLRLAVSAAIRLTLIVAATFFAIGAGADGRHIIIAFLGFLAVRQIMIIRTSRKAVSSQRCAEL